MVPMLDWAECAEPGGEHLLAALSYWCQGKPGGCRVPPALAPCPGLSGSWHLEPDFNSREIPCPSYGHGALEKKFSK
jgi:hypothetical protein